MFYCSLLTYWSNSNPTSFLVQNVKQIIRKQFIAAFEHALLLLSKAWTTSGAKTHDLRNFVTVSNTIIYSDHEIKLRDAYYYRRLFAPSHVLNVVSVVCACELLLQTRHWAIGYLKQDNESFLDNHPCIRPFKKSLDNFRTV